MRVGDSCPGFDDLPSGVRANAHVFHNGEVAWPNEHAEAAIGALADAGRLILGLDARALSPDGGVSETPISAWAEEPSETRDDQVRRGRAEALDALPFALQKGTHVLVTWDQ